MATLKNITSLSNDTVRAAATGLPNSRRAVLSILAGAAAIVPAASAMAAWPAHSEALRVAIATHRAEQAKVDEMAAQHPDCCEDDYEDAFAAACSVAEAALWVVAETPCSNDSDFFVKLFYLFEDERRELGGVLSYDDIFGKLAFAIEMQRAA